jgi:hypothetical protein
VIEPRFAVVSRYAAVFVTPGVTLVNLFTNWLCMACQIGRLECSVSNHSAFPPPNGRCQDHCNDLRMAYLSDHPLLRNARFVKIFNGANNSNGMDTGAGFYGRARQFVDMTRWR